MGKIARRTLDIAMAVLTLVLMGGNGLFYNALRIVRTIINAGVVAYGIYAFIVRGLWKYLTLQQPFFFLDLECGYLLFALDYIAIMALFAMAMQFVTKAIAKNSR